MAHDEIAIKVDHVSKNFKLPHEKVDSVKSLFVNPFKSKAHLKTETQHALKDIDFEVKKGEFFGIVGRNGSGKSTLLKIMAGIYQPTKGGVTVNGRLVPFIELGVGFNPELTGRENVYLNGALMGFSDKEVDAKYSSIVSFAELERFMDQKLKNYSSGMQVRLAFSVATILADSEILLIDEVLAVGDADFQRKCFNYFKTLKKYKKTVIFVSHDMSAIREYCDNAVLINDSKIECTGTANDVAKQYSKLFLENEAEDSYQGGTDRWGNGDIITSSIRAEKTDDYITIRQHIKAIRRAEPPIVGIRIRSASGSDITGTNTKIEGINIGKIEAGEQVEIVWRIPNIFAEGRYVVDPSIILEDGITNSDWWDEACEINIKKRFLPYDIDPGFSIEVRRGDHD